jgi:cyclic pyranopterin phosphate synthase
MSTTPTGHAALSHLDESGQIRMVDVGGKTTTQRTAIAEGRVRMSAAAYKLLSAQDNAKGEVLNTARVAGILAAKRCAELIPLCHTLPLSFVGIEFLPDAAAGSIVIRTTCRSDYKTGVEMEAMMACSVAALTIYDMCKAADKGIVLEQIRLRYKSGGKSGEWRND